MELLFVMEYTALVITLLLFLTGIPPMLQMYKTGSTKNVPYILFLLNGVSCTGIFHYGVLKGLTTIMFLNGVGLVLQWSYVLMYLSLVQSKSKSMLYLMTAIAYMVGLYSYLYLIVLDEGKITDIVGGTSSLVCTIVMSLPLLEVVENIRKKNTEGMPVIMLLAGLACSTSWLIYGLMLDDPNIYRPNIPGILITMVKVYVIRMYSTTPEKVKEA